MSRTLLFVQTGDGRPKCVGGSFPEYLWRRGGEKMHELFYDKRLGDVRLAFMYGKWVVPFRAADRWWLVECENAEAGRWIIGMWLPSDGSNLVVARDSDQSFLAKGRILASGGRS